MRLQVAIGQLRVVDMPATLIGTALGSCVGLMIFEKTTPIAGLAHIMLPSSKHGRLDNLPAKFADLAVPRMLSKLEGLGADRRLCQAKLAGGACMFSGLESISSDMGARNIEAVKNQLSKYDIPIVAEDTGGEHARTVEFDTTAGTILIRSLQFGDRRI